MRRIKFKETTGSGDGGYHFATCSDDATTRIFKIAPARDGGDVYTDDSDEASHST